MARFVADLAGFLGGRRVVTCQWPKSDRVVVSCWQVSGGAVAHCEMQGEHGTRGASVPLPGGCGDVVVCMGEPPGDDVLQGRWISELWRLTGRCLWVTFECDSSAKLLAWEQKFLEAGFRKHPLWAALRPFGTDGVQNGVAALVFEKVPAPALERYPLSALRAERDLHMDMLREAGLRSEAHLARYELARRHVREGMVVVDVACGLGYGAAVLAHATGASRVIGVDCSRWAVDYARLNYGSVDRRLHFQVGDARDLSFLADDSVDLVVSFETLEHVPNPDRVLAEFRRVLKPGGIFIGSVPNLWVDSEGRNPVPYHLHVFDFEGFHALVARHFRWRSLFRQNACGGWKPPQPPGLVCISECRPCPEDERNAEWWIAIAERPDSGSEVHPPVSGGERGQSVEAAPRRIRYPSAGRTSTAVLATNYLLWTPATRWMWETLARELERHGCQLVLLSTTLPDPPVAFPVDLHPYLLRDFARMFPAWAGEGENWHLAPGEAHWLKADMSRVGAGYGMEEALAGLSAFRTYTETWLKELRPAILLLADNTLAQTALLQRRAWDLHLPVLIYERGLLPDTLMVESRGIQAWSDVRTHWCLQEMPGVDPVRYEEIRSYYVTRRPEKYPQPQAPVDAGSLRRQLGVGDRKLVVFLGGGFEANGHSPKGGIRDRVFFPGFSTTEETLLALWRAVQRRGDAFLVFKPHPLDPNPYALARVEGIPVVRDVNVHALIEAADVVAAQYTTLQFEAVFWDKPVLLLARSAWWGRGATYEVTGPEELDVQLDRSMSRQDWERIRERARAFVTWLMDAFLIGAAPEVPARRCLSHFAEYLARVAMDCRGMPPVAERLEKAMRRMEEHRVRL